MRPSVIPEALNGQPFRMTDARALGVDRGPIGRVDLVYLAYRLIIEYEGDQHRSRNQWNRDIDRQEDFARDNWTLIRVTSERARWPRQVVRTVYQALRANGYDGPAPSLARSGSASSSECALSAQSDGRMMGR
jgi:Protein of unknown function (DUF559)